VSEQTSPLFNQVYQELEYRGHRLRPQGKGYLTNCPNPSHQDRHPSFFLYRSGAGRCYSQCDHYWNPREMAELLGIEEPIRESGLTLQELAVAKGLPVEFLRSFGVSDGVSGRHRGKCVDIPYADETSTVTAVRKRLSLHGDPRFLWRKGDKVLPYGLPQLVQARRQGFIVLTEGESDIWTLWWNQFPALGIPGASTWRTSWTQYVAGLRVYFWHEPDQGGNRLLEKLATDLPDLLVIEAPQGFKDPSDLFQFDPQDFRKRFQDLLGKARAVSEIKAHLISAAAKEALELARPLLKLAIEKSGFVGDSRPAMMSYVTLTSRLLSRPLSMASIAQSSSGKNAAVEVVLPMFPEEAYYYIGASSPRVLVFNNESFQHRIVIFSEADSLPEDGSAASAIRSIITDSQMVYEVTIKSDDGDYHTSRIVKIGPTGLITTTTRRLGPQVSTRILEVPISDSPSLTTLILHAKAESRNGARPSPDFTAWVALQRWLALQQEWRVAIPFGHVLADLMPNSAVRMRRDFEKLLTTIEAIALLRQHQRQRDPQRRVVATFADYQTARWLLEEIFTTSVNEGLGTAIRETVERVKEMLQNGAVSVSETDLVNALGLAKSTVNYRVRRAIRGGWLVNNSTKKGAPAELVLGSTLPDANPLPSVESLLDALVALKYPENHSNTRTLVSESDTERDSNTDSNT
jgi:hypothetical protein